MPVDPPTDDPEKLNDDRDKTSGAGWMSRVIRYLAGLTGWRGALTTITLGAVAAAALPPVHFLPGLFAFSVLAWRLERGIGAAQAAWQGWLFGFGYHLAGLYWISNALLVESDKFAVFVPLAAIGLPMALACFPAAVMAFLPWLAAPGWLRAVAVAALWSSADYARGHLFTGFPWNLPAYAFSVSHELSQTASVTGAYGLSLLVLVFAVGPAVIAGPDRGFSRRRNLIGFGCLALPALLWAAGAARLDAAPPAADEKVVIRLVQGNIAQKDKWKPELRARHLATYLELSRARSPSHRAPGLADGTEPTVIIWPETAVPGFLAQDRNLRHAVAAAAPQTGTLVTGAPTISEDLPRRVYNSMIGIGADGLISARYDKVHLVPFGEYVPLRSLNLLPRVVQSFTDFTPGSARTPLNVAGLGLVSPLICYEIIFPGEVATGGGARPVAALLNLTNDAWYGRSSGPYQHLAISKMRAIEEGIPLIRAANTGISGIYDAYGRTMVQIPLSEKGIADGYLPMRSEQPTTYSKIGDLFYLIIFGILCIGLLLYRLLYHKQ